MVEGDDTDTTWWDESAAARQYKADARRRDAASNELLAETYKQGKADASPTPAPTRTRSVSSPRRSTQSNAVTTTAEVFLGALGFALGSAWLAEGPAGVKAWIAAKFANKV